MLDKAFAGCTPAQQEGFLRKTLGLPEAIPAFLTQVFREPGMLDIPPFLWHGSIFACYVLDKSTDGVPFNPDLVAKNMARRFGLHWSSQQARDSSALYLLYLAKAGFLETIIERRRVRFAVRHNCLHVPDWGHPDTRFDDASALNSSCAGSGELRSWRSEWPRWRSIRDDAEEMLAASPHRATILAALQGLDALSRPPTPNHWAQPLVSEGVPLRELMALLAALGMIT